jgi:hypothetical protein
MAKEHLFLLLDTLIHPLDSDLHLHRVFMLHRNDVHHPRRVTREQVREPR